MGHRHLAQWLLTFFWQGLLWKFNECQGYSLQKSAHLHGWHPYTFSGSPATYCELKISAVAFAQLSEGLLLCGCHGHGSLKWKPWKWLKKACYQYACGPQLSATVASVFLISLHGHFFLNYEKESLSTHFDISHQEQVEASSPKSLTSRLSDS